MAVPNISRIGKYEVIEILGRGGMGLVYRAFDRQLNREVAIKTLTEGFAGDQEMLQRFYREAAKTAALKHPNIVIVYDLGEQGGFPYIVMEYLAGDPLDKLIQGSQAITLAFKLRVIEQVCYALGYAHRNEVIHRDVKPANVIVQPDGVSKLLDFGIARQEKYDSTLTRTGHVIGTIQYMAPERIKNRPFDGRSDIFSTGIMLYQVLTGELPFGGEDYSIVHSLLNESHPPLSQHLQDYPKALDAIIDRAIAKDPDDRYSTAEEMAGEIFAVAEELKKDQASELYDQAKRLVQGEQYTTARDVLLQLVKVDSQHKGARQLMSVVQQNLSRRQREEQIRQLRSKADEAMHEKRYDEAIARFQEALRIDSSNAELAGLLEAARQRKRIREQIDGYLRQAEAARNLGDLERAQAVIGKAAEVDKADSRVQAALAALARDIEEASRQVKAKKLLDSARSEISNRHFAAAVDLLTEAEKFDPSNPELISLLDAARKGREQEQRRRILDQLQNEISLANTPDQFRHAAKAVDEALASIPTEPLLLKFKAQLARQIGESNSRRRVDEIVQRCRALLENSPREALEVVTTALREMPGSERLLTLQSSIEARLHNRSLEESRAHYLGRAHEALNDRKYADAIRLLESCQAEGIFSDEFAELLDFARQEYEHQQRKSRIEELSLQAQGLMAKGAFEAAIDLLRPASKQADATSLRPLLEKALSQQQSLQRQIETALSRTGEFMAEEQYQEAMTFLELQSEPVLRSQAIQAELGKVREAREHELAMLQALGRAYAALEKPDIDLSCNLLKPVSPGQSVLPLLGRVLPMVEARRRSLADQSLTKTLQRCRTALNSGDPKVAGEELEAATALKKYASAELQGEWDALQKKASRAKLLGRVGIRRPGSGPA